MDKKVMLRLVSLLTHIQKVLKDTDGLSLDDFRNSDLLVRASCFSIVQIGEQMVRLEESLGELYPAIPWKRARGMRNFIVHDYDHIDVEQVFSVIETDLPELQRLFGAVLDNLKVSQ